MLMMLPLLPAAEISGYDITFAKTINDSLMVNDSEKFGLDYTGYGYLGDSRTGIYIRAGIQAPFSSLEMIIDNSKEHPGYTTDEDTEKIRNMLETSFRFSSAMGPAFRSTISDKMIWYMGLGLSSSLDYANRRGNVMAAVSYIDISIGVSFDAGFRIDLEENTTIRIGMSIETLLFSISFMTYSSGDGGDELLAGHFHGVVELALGECGVDHGEGGGFVGVEGAFGGGGGVPFRGFGHGFELLGKVTFRFHNSLF